MPDDFVSRQWLIDEYHRRHQGPTGGALKMIEEAPAADVAEVRHGRWKGPRYRFGSDELACTMCGHWIKVRAGSELPKYCDQCGAKMDGEEDDAEVH